MLHPQIKTNIYDKSLINWYCLAGIILHPSRYLQIINYLFPSVDDEEHKLLVKSSKQLLIDKITKRMRNSVRSYAWHSKHRVIALHRSSLYYYLHHDKYREMGRLWYKKNREKVLKNNRDYYLKNKERILKRIHDYYIKHKEEKLKKRHEYYLKRRK